MNSDLTGKKEFWCVIKIKKEDWKRKMEMKKEDGVFGVGQKIIIPFIMNQWNERSILERG